MNKNRAEFAHSLRQGKTVWAAGVYDALSAKLAEAAGFPALMTSGFAVSASLLGQPDVEVYTMTENLSVARNVSNAVNIPVVADTDTAVDAGGDSTGDSGSDDATTDDTTPPAKKAKSDEGCSAAGGGSWSWLALLGLLAFARRRRA